MKRLPQFALIFTVALLYALATRLLFTFAPFDKHLVVVSCSFLFLMPLAFGALTTFLGCNFYRRSKFWIYGAPPLAGLAGLLASIVFQLEAVLCAVVAAPIFLTFAFLGGVLMGWILSKGSGRLKLSFVVLLPFAASPP